MSCINSHIHADTNVSSSTANVHVHVLLLLYVLRNSVAARLTIGKENHNNRLAIVMLDNMCLQPIEQGVLQMDVSRMTFWTLAAMM